MSIERNTSTEEPRGEKGGSTLRASIQKGGGKPSELSRGFGLNQIRQTVKNATARLLLNPRAST